MYQIFHFYKMSTLVPQLKALIAKYYIVDQDYTISFDDSEHQIKLTYQVADIDGLVTFEYNQCRTHNLAVINAIENQSNNIIIPIYLNTKAQMLSWNMEFKQFYISHGRGKFYYKLPKFLVPIILTILHVCNFDSDDGTTNYNQRFEQFKQHVVNGKIKS